MLVSEGKILYFSFLFRTFMFTVFSYLQVSLMYSSPHCWQSQLDLVCVRCKASRPFVLVTFPSNVIRIDSVSLIPPPSACSQYRCHLPKWHLWKLLNLKNKKAFDLWKVQWLFFFPLFAFWTNWKSCKWSEELSFLIVKIGFKESKHSLYP